MRPKSNTLFHFTKSRETLKLILKNGFWPRYCLEDISWLGYPTHDWVAYPTVCFCEIPLMRISEHVAFYGDFGIGLKREWAQANGINPIMYMAGENEVTRSFRLIGEHAFKLANEDAKEAALHTVRYLIAHAKPVEGRMWIDGDPIQKIFYQESEWRYVPKKSTHFPDYLQKVEYDDMEKREIQNNLTKSHACIKFSPTDIRYIFVKEDSDIPDVVNFIMSELDQYSGSDQKILTARVLSLEALAGDL
ncbi:abortive infection system antitoxin AbiGi family protein [Xanthomonas campestris]|uniref:abortive infection system antitoxin AbiGi family protein n=1 Tax=Xanthomonas campestris TaxID=339 RepID=UPI00236558AA|nr:abortive infection system antitoxin AbiGi family protein [Xanthomonas campestris]MEA9712477.1 abortive infection system antitoxin AbiGi family protein [Xanthomonas campestris]MEA9785099.1 abortive infection system antitoxin AbiGi family protein [Xanthomonas campestris pv. raphani]MEA9793393.1 abortive infection system antitoxin AbiGi family protein [Xanthomonas campestris pv. raphani]MEA9805220.1 abortive infection system antitoxin AbiGi family protein [Xanthomonas campestris pv. raphani]ME